MPMKSSSPGEGAVDLPVHLLVQARFHVDPVDAQDLGEAVRLRHRGEGRLPRPDHEADDAQDGGAQERLHHVRWAAPAPPWPRRSAQVDAMSATGMARRRLARFMRRKPGPGGQRAAQRHQQPRASHEVQVEGAEAADDGHEEHAASHASHRRQDAHDERHPEEHHRPEPPRRDAAPRPRPPPPARPPARPGAAGPGAPPAGATPATRATPGPGRAGRGAKAGRGLVTGVSGIGVEPLDLQADSRRRAPLGRARWMRSPVRPLLRRGTWPG